MSRRKTTKEVIEGFKKVHGDKYNYSLVEYVNNSSKVKIICPEHDIFEQSPSKHLIGRGCPKCGLIKGAAKKRFFHKKQRNWDFEQHKDYKLIPIHGGYLAKVDNDDFDKLKDINWTLHTGYAFNNKFGFMHRYIMNTPNLMSTDHINHDTLDNRRFNLRVCTKSENAMNIIKTKLASSKYKGVYWDKRIKKWVARVHYNYNYNHVGNFDNETDAAKAYDKKDIEIFGEFANTNFK